MRGELTLEQVLQVRRLLVALHKAHDWVKAMPVQTPESVRASNNLFHSRVLFEKEEKNISDLRTSVFLGHWDKNFRRQVMEILRNNPSISTLHALGSAPWTMVQAVFNGNGINCPLEFLAFHEAYQEELKNSSGKPPELPDPVGFAYMG